MRVYRLLAAHVLAAACSADGTSPEGGPQNAPPATVTVRATPAITFNPSPADLVVGGVATFSFEGTAHNVYFRPAQGAPSDIPGNNANVQLTRTFPQVGTFDYDCRIHAGMSGRIVVRTTGSSGPGNGPGYP